MKHPMFFLLMLSLVTVVSCGDDDWERPQPRVAPGQQPAGTQPTGTTTTPTAGSSNQVPTTPTTQTPTTPTVPNTPTTPQAPAVTYTAFVQPLVQRSCLGAGCHNSAGAAAGIALDTQANMRTNFTRSIQSIDAKRMPTSARAPLTADEIAKLKQWQASNFP